MQWSDPPDALTPRPTPLDSVSALANPTRPNTGDVIATTWGLAVADRVVRDYATVAARTSDLTGYSPSQLLGMATYIEATGNLEVYVGPVLQWRPPWNTAWGWLAYAQTNTGGNVCDGTARISATINALAGRRLVVTIRASAVAPHGAGLLGTLVAGGAQQYKRIPDIPSRVACSATYSDRTPLGVATAASLTWGSMLQIVGTNYATDAVPSADVLIEDGGPSAVPTMVERDGWDAVSLDGEPVRVPGILTPAEYAEALTIPDYVSPLEELWRHEGGREHLVRW